MYTRLVLGGRVQERSAFEPTIPEAARRYWWLVAFGTLAGGFLGLILAFFVFNDAVAVNTILIEDPAASQVFDTGTSARPERYLASQVAILESPDMARTVAGLDPTGTLDPGDVIDARSVISDPAEDVIRIEFVHPDSDVAIQYANAFGEAYRQYRTDVTTETFQAAISGLDTSIAALEQERAAVDAEIEQITTVPGEEDLAIELESAIRAFLASPNTEATAEEVNDILSQMESLQVIRALENQDPTLTLLYEARRDIMDRRSQLEIRRDQLQVDATLASTGIVAISETAGAQPAVGRSRVIAMTAVLGAAAGLTVAYALAMRSRRFDHRSEPELLLDAPMLAEIPIFRRKDPIPAKTDPLSPAAEAFRFAASAVEARLGQLESASGSKSNSATITSALAGEGKSIVTLNAGLSLAAKGDSVLILDADFDARTLTHMVVGDDSERIADLFRSGQGKSKTASSNAALPGITDLFEGRAKSIENVVVPIDVTGHKVHLLTRGTLDVPATDFFSSPYTVELFQILQSGYDYVLVDAPALLQISYATSLARLTDAVVIVVPHDSLVSTQQEVLKRLDVVGATILGYVYNKAPRRGEAKERRGVGGYLSERRRISVS